MSNDSVFRDNHVETEIAWPRGGAKGVFIDQERFQDGFAKDSGNIYI